MASTYSTRLRLELMANGDQSGTWGTTNNTNIGTLLEEAISGYSSIALSDANTTLSANNGATDQARQMMLRFTGTLTAARNITVPSSSKLYLVHNATTGGFALNFKTSGGASVAVPNGSKAFVYCDGTDCFIAPNTVYMTGTGLLGSSSGAGAATIIDISTLTEDTAPAPASDFLLSYDASASALKKIYHKSVKPIESFIIALGDETTNITTGGDKARFCLPYNFTVTEVKGSLSYTGSSQTVFDVNAGGSTILSTKCTVASGQFNSESSTQAVVSVPTLAAGALISIDIDTAGTNAKGAKVAIIGYKT